MVAMPSKSKSLPTKDPDELLGDIYDTIPDNDEYWYGSTDAPYAIETGNWYKTIPYGFRVVGVNKTLNQLRTGLGQIPGFKTLPGPATESLCFFFPVNPESINISTPFAVQVTPTMGGIVEEHSGAVFYNITISGTTGVIPEIDFSNGVARNPKDLRTTASGDGLIPSGALGGFGAGTINAINSAVSKFTGIDSKLVDKARNNISGYTVFHVLYKFIWLYHQAKANGSMYELQFVNYKDNNQYNVIVQNFQLSRDKSRPHLYQYTIQMKGWKLDVNSADIKFTKSANDRLAELGLSEGPSIKAMMFRVINTTKSTLNAAAGLLNTAAQDLAI